MKSRRAWTDMLSAPAIQPVLFDPVALASTQPKRRKPGTVKRPELLESALQKVIYEALQRHPRVASIDRINVMAGRLLGKNGKPSRFLRSAKKGHADLEGFATDGKIIAIEVKRPSTRNHLSPEQRAHLEAIRKAGGYAGVATSVEEAFAILKAVPAAETAGNKKPWINEPARSPQGHSTTEPLCTN